MFAISFEYGVVFAATFVLLHAFRANYGTHLYKSFSQNTKPLSSIWNMSFAIVLFSNFLLRKTEDLSRISVFLYYIFGFMILILLRLVLMFFITKLATAGWLITLRVILVGSPDEIEMFASRHQAKTFGVDVLGWAPLRGSGTLSEDLGLATSLARVLRPDTIFVLSPWADDDETSLTIIRSLMAVPAAIHLISLPLLDRFQRAEMVRLGSIHTLRLTRRPMSIVESVAKRTFDILVSALALTLSIPLFATIALLIKLESRGPVFVNERRLGFNQRIFHALSFRIAQVDGITSTRIGQLLRKTEIEHLPALINVLKNDMSLVGPKPHPGDYQKTYTRHIAGYSRRHNVKPGLTGWAQIHALRREETSAQALQAHIAHDLDYIERRSLAFDLWILIRRFLLITAADRRRVIADVGILAQRSRSRAQLFETVFKLDFLPIRHLDVLGIPIDDVSLDNALKLGQACLLSDKSRILFIANAHTLNLASASQAYRRVLEQAHLIFGDGSGVRLAARFKGLLPLANLNGTDLIPALLASITDQPKTCYLLGAEHCVVKKAAEEISRRYSNWTVTGYHHGFLDARSNAKVLSEIEALRPDLLLVGMGNPNQEYWIAENFPQLRVKLVVGVGALFSYLSGDYDRAPLRMRRFGVEWLWILVMQPHKWRRYIFGNPAFIGRVILDVVRSRSSRSSEKLAH